MQKTGDEIMMMMMNYFYGMVDWQKVWSIIFNQEHSQIFSQLQISGTPVGGMQIKLE